MIKLFVIDVDGTLTDGSIIYDDNGTEIKSFNTRDGAAFFALKEMGIKIMILTGRECRATERRMTEMRVDYLFQDVDNKSDFLHAFCENNSYSKEEVAYIGDELNDISAMRLCGYVGCPSDACKEVKEMADYISVKKGGEGVLRDIVEHYFDEFGVWTQVVEKIYNITGK